MKLVEQRDAEGKVVRTSFEWDGKDGLIGYLRFLAAYHPPTFGGLLGRIMPTEMNIKSDHRVAVVHYPNTEDVRDAALAKGIDPVAFELALQPKFLIEYKRKAGREH